jgi:tetratricopeptide (TPR) repeat protein
MAAKAAQYIERLDNARCEGNWADVPELVRKIRKHAPDRACLTLAAEAECAITQVTKAATAQSSGATHRPPTVEASEQSELSSKVPKLVEAIENEQARPEDRFQAQVAVGWLHWVFAEYTQALARLPKPDDSDFDPASASTQWTKVAALKATYLRADSLTRNHERKQALATFQDGLPLVSSMWSSPRLSPQLRYWSELYMTEFCVLWNVALEDEDVSLQDANALSSYRAWAKYWETVSSAVTGGFGFKGSIPRRQVWENYYLALSRILEDDMPIPTGHVNKITNDLSARNQLRIELKGAEAAYQALLLGETTFPRAEEGRPEVEAFVRRVVKNWAIMCGRGWQERDLGQGGRDSLSRGVLDTLYSAATKTYHSPAILRFLFLLHLSVAEFDLAFRAFDSYMDIVKKVKARVDKTGELDESLDEDGIVLETISQGIMALCRFGDQPAAEKAYRLGGELEDWLAKLPQLKPTDSTVVTTAEEKEKIQLLHPPVPPQIVALAWQAIGLAHAHWARVTHEATSRTEIQSKAVRCLRRSLSTELGRSKDIRTFFTLGLLLAERRELTAAIDLVKSALISSRGPEEQNNVLYGAYWRERSLVPVWNLLALLLSARQDYVMAARACEGALEQFNDPSILFGSGDSTFRSEHLSDAESGTGSARAPKGLVDEMDDAEKEGILEVKMTQLALVELQEGPEVAVNASFELLTLYSRLFGTQPSPSALALPKATEPPKTAVTTHKSIRGSIFGGRHSRATARESTGAQSDLSSARPQTAQTVASVAPSIQVTGENGGMANHPRYQRGTSMHRQRSETRRRNSLKKRSQSHSRQRSSSMGEAAHKAATTNTTTVVDGEQFFTPAVERDQNDFFTNSSRMPPPISLAFGRSKTVRSFKSQASLNSKAADPSEPPIESIYASTNLLPLVNFPKDRETAQRTTILVRIWLVIAGFYRRAGMHEDCKGAIGEAQKLVQDMDAEAAKEPSAASGGIRNVGWAEQKSVNDLWGDVYTEAGLLFQAKSAHNTARSEFESALTHCPNHPAAIVGLSNILLDIYSEELLPPPAIPSLSLHGPWPSTSGAEPAEKMPKEDTTKRLPIHPLGLGTTKSAPPAHAATGLSAVAAITGADDQLPAPYKATSLSLIDRLAARERAYALLSGLTRLGSGWNRSDAWFALARAHEESGQPDKAKEALWWCVELEEATGIRDWRCLAGGRYII